MTEGEQAKALTHELLMVLNHYCDEFDMTVATVLGVIEMVKLDLFRREWDAHDKEDGDKPP